MVYTVTLTGGIGSADVVFDYTVTGTATAGENADYTDPGNGKLTILATTAEGTITLNVKGDTVQETSETLVVTLTKVSTAKGMVSIGSPNVATTTIREGARILEFTTQTQAGVSVANEGGSAEFGVELTGNTDTVTVRYDVVAGTATTADYTAPSGILTLTGATGTIMVETKDDILAEDAETFSVKLSPSGLPNDVGLGFATATATIPASDTLTARVVRHSDAVFEGATAVFTVMLKAGTDADADPGAGSQEVVVSYDTGGIAMAPNDYEAPSGTLIIPAGQSEGTIMIPTLADELLEPDEAISVTLSDVATGAGMAHPANDGGETAPITIRDRSGTVLASVADTTATEGDPANFIVTLSGKVSEDVTVTYQIDPGSATENQDYTNSPKLLVIAEGSTTSTITVPTAEPKTPAEQRAEAPETFTVTLLTATAQGLQDSVKVGTRSATGTIVDNDSLTASLTGPAQVREGSSAVYMVELAGGAGSMPVDVTYVIGGTATPGTDYTAPSGMAPSGMLNIPANEMAGSFAIDTSADQQLGETLELRLTGASTNAGTVVLGTDHELTTTIIAENAAIISVMDVTPMENGSADFQVTLLSGTLGDRVKLRYETADGSAGAEDYTALSGTLTIPVNSDDTYGTNNNDDGAIPVTINDDDLAENTETFTLMLSLENPPDDVILATPAAEATIEDNDTLTVSVRKERDNVVEGTDAIFLVELAGGTSTEDVVVGYDVEGDAKENTDYEAPSGTLTLLAGTSTGTIEIPTTADDLLEVTASETLTVTLKNTTTTAAGMLEVSDLPATTRIADHGTVTASIAGSTVTEGGKAVFPVTLSGKVSTDVVVEYTIANSSTEGTEDADFPDPLPSRTGNVPIKVGETTGSIPVATFDDMLAEDTETFTVTLRLVPNSRVALGTAVATGTIRDNERLTVIVEGPDKVAQGQDANYKVRLRGGTGSEEVKVNYTQNGVAAQTPITIAAERDEPANDLEITTGSDQLVEGRTLVIRLTSVNTDAGTGGPGVAEQ